MNCRISLCILFCFLGIACGHEDDITEEPNTDRNPHFSWDITIELEQPNGWGLTVFPERVTLSNISEGKQYMISWKGELSAGEKKEGMLHTVIRGNQTKITELEVLEVQDFGNGCYGLNFRGGGRKGKMIFIK